jgi:hypothetical protein
MKLDLQEHPVKRIYRRRRRDVINQHDNTRSTQNNLKNRRGCQWEELIIFSKTNITHEQQMK